MPDSPPERLQQKARGWQAESPSATEPDELRAQLQGFWRLLFTSSSARARDGVTGYGALHSACTSWMTRVHYTATSGLAPNPEPEPALCPVSLQVPPTAPTILYQVRSLRRGVCSPSSSATRSKWRVATRSHFRRSRSWATPGRGARSWRWARATSASRRRRARASSACSRRAPHLRRLCTPAFAPRLFAPRLSPPHAPPRLFSSYCAPLPQPLLHSFRTLPSVLCHPFAGLPQG